MAQRIEWRSRGETDDAILFFDDDQNTVRQALVADPTVLRVFLNQLVDLDTWQNRQSVDDAQRNPAAWGDLVMARATSGEVLDMDPELFWHGIADWFRSRGTDAWIQTRGIDPH